MSVTREEISIRRKEARRREIAERVLPSIEVLLQQAEGWQALSVEQILQKSGLTRASFYRHFQDKADLLIALGEPILINILEIGMGPWRLAPNMTIERFEQEFGQTIRAYLPHVGLLGAMVEASAYDSRVREKYLAVFNTVRHTLAERIEEGQRGGYLRQDLPARETAGWLTWMAERGMTQMVGPARDEERLKLAESLAKVVWFSVYEPQP